MGQPFGFSHTPFSKTIPASQLCERASLQEAIARIRFTIAEALLGVLTGEVGVGKTVAVRAATAQLDPTAHHVIYVSNPAFGTRGLYVTIVRALGAMPRFHKAELIAQAQSLLAAEEQERRRRVVLIVDEAHLLSPDQLEEIRLLTNAEMDAVNPFALLLVGQPTLARQLRLGVFAALDQRRAQTHSRHAARVATAVGAARPFALIAIYLAYAHVHGGLVYFGLVTPLIVAPVSPPLALLQVTNRHVVEHHHQKVGLLGEQLDPFTFDSGKLRLPRQLPLLGLPRLHQLDRSQDLSRLLDRSASRVLVICEMEAVPPCGDLTRSTPTRPGQPR